MSHLNKIQHLQQLMEKLHCDAFLIEDKINLYYLTGLELSSGILLVQAQDCSLIVDHRYYELCQKLSPVPVLLTEQQGLVDLLSSIKHLGFESEHTSYKRYQEIQKLGSHLTLVPLTQLIETERSIKDEEELHLLRQAAELGSQGFDYICSLLKEGISEREIATELEIYWKRLGCKVGFDPIIAFGANASMPHYRAGNVQLQKNQAVLIDIGVDFQHYHSDMSRVVYFGTPPSEIQNIYSIVQEAQARAMNFCKPGISIGQLDEMARSFISNQGYGKYFTHSLGHGLGLQIHELPIIRNKEPYQGMTLKKGMVITIEPGIYLPNIGGVRLEDSIVITDQGYENLTIRPCNPFL